MWITLAVPLAVALLAGHPLHTTHTDLIESEGEVTLLVRAFSDDLRAAVSRQEGGVTDSSLARYVQRTVVLTDGGGRPLPLTWVGEETRGDVTLLRLRAARPGGLSGIRVIQRMHMELFDDQVNVLQASYADRRVSLLFVPGDPPKRLP